MTHPWLHFYTLPLTADILDCVRLGLDPLTLLNGTLSHVHTLSGKAVQCVPQAALPSAMAYETFVFETGCIPTRTLAHSKGALHDACNALVWAHYPRTKAMLNHLQALVIQAQGIHHTRGAVRDALTLFDESALVLCCPSHDIAAKQLAARQWSSLLYQRATDWHTVIHPHILGHAILQKLQHPYPSITAQVWVLPGVDGANPVAVDTALADSLEHAYQTGQLQPSTLLPLPVMGIPGWAQGVQDAAFYSNTQVFRPLAHD